MANPQLNRVPQQTLDDDVEAFLMLDTIVGYQTFVPEFTLAAATQDYQEMRAAEKIELQLESALAAARDTRVARQSKFHTTILGVKDQVKAQFGPDSDQVAALGLKKKSERKAPSRKAEVK